MNWRLSCILACWLPLAAHAVEVDPVPSVMWAFYHKQLLADAPFAGGKKSKKTAKRT